MKINQIQYFFKQNEYFESVFSSFFDSLFMLNNLLYDAYKRYNMGIPRFYRWLKGRYPMLRVDLSDSGKQIPNFDNLFIDFNALIYQCIRESGCFLKNKVNPLTHQQITLRVFQYLLQLVRTANPKKMIYIALDGVAPRAKINQSRDRRFKSGVEDIQFFDRLAEQLDLHTQQIFQANSISPGTEFLFELCEQLRKKIMELISTEWKGLNVIYSDCCVPGEGEHKIMEFLRYSKSIQLFNKNTTHCVYSPDADVILLTLALNIDNICVIKQDTSVMPSQSWTASSVVRKPTAPRFELAMINILREYFSIQFSEVLEKVKGSTVQAVINDLVLLMAFVGNDFLPNQFCFVLKDNHLDSLFSQYKEYLLEHHEFINNDGDISWNNISKLLKLAKRFEANMISEMKNARRSRPQHHHAPEPKGHGTVFDDQQQNGEQPEDSQLQKFEVQDSKIVQGVQSYYRSRFNIQERASSNKFTDIVQKYIEGLEFYCQYYYKGLPSWQWFYPYHYTPLLCDVDQYISRHPVKVTFAPSQPYEPILALMYMLPEPNFRLLPKQVADALRDPKSILKTPIDYFPAKFELDKYETLKYNKRALIEFLKDDDVKTVYKTIPKEALTIQRNTRKNPVLYFQAGEAFSGMEVAFDSKHKDEIKKIVRVKYEGKQKESNQRRFPTLTIYGEKPKMNEKALLVSQYKYKHNGNPAELVFFNNFLGYVIDSEKVTASMKEEIESSYAKYGLYGSCEIVYIVRKAELVREWNRFHLYPSHKEVAVPDFALFKAPNYDYIPKTRQFQQKELYSKKERVVVLTKQYFGCVGTIEELQQANVRVKLQIDPPLTSSKIEALEDDFYSIEYVLKRLEITWSCLFSIISEVIILPKFGKKKDFNERLPTAINFGLSFVDPSTCKIVPSLVRISDFSKDNPRNPQEVLDYLQISSRGLKLLEWWVNEFHWLVEAIESDRSPRLRKQFKAANLFPKEKDPNIKLYSQFVKLYSIENSGKFQSIYSKVSNPELPDFYTEKKGGNAIVTLQYHEIFSRSQALVAPPAYRSQPQFHDIGSRIILLRTLELGYVIGIDDHWIEVILGRERRKTRVHFADLYNEGWESNLSKEAKKCWDYGVSYYTPSFWKKTITE